MPKSDAKKQSDALRREARLSRLKTAGALMPYYLGRFGGMQGSALNEAVRMSVQAADALIAEVDRTAPPLPAPPPPG